MQWLLIRTILPPQNIWKLLETFLVVKTVGDRDGDFSGPPMGRWRRDVAAPPAMPRTAPHNKGLSGPRCQECQGWGALF